MGAIEIVRRVDDLGRIVIPKEIRKQLGIRDGDPMEYFLTENGIILKPYKEKTESESIAKEINEKLDSVGALLGEIKTLLEE